MGFASIDDLVNEITTNGKFLKAPYQKISNNGAASAAGRWHETLQWAGFPTALTLTGTAGTAFTLSDASTGAWYHGGNVSTNTKHLLSMLAMSPTATVVPATAILCDFLVVYPSLVVTGTPTTLTATALPRYTTGEGVQAIVSVVSALGAAQPALTFTYTDQGGTGGNVAGAITAPANSVQLSTLFQDNAVGGPFMRLAAGDRGVRSVQSYTLASGTTGAVSLILVKPLATIPILAVNTASERDYLYQLPSLPKIEDGACLGFIVQAGGAMAASSIFLATADLGWG